MKRACKQFCVIALILIAAQSAHAVVIGNISGTFETDYAYGIAPVGTDATNFLSPLLGGSFQVSYTLPSMPTPGSWPSFDSWDISFFDASANLVSTMASSDPGNTVYFLDFGPGDDSLFFNNSSGEGPALQVIYPNNFVGYASGYVNNSNVAWYDGSIGAYWGEILVVHDSGSSVISSVPEPTTIALMSLGLAGLGYARKKRT